jgi:hypothetical protein
MLLISTQHERKQWRFSWRTSFVLHIAVCMAMILWMLWLPMPAGEQGAHTFIQASSAPSDPIELIVATAPLEESWLMREATTPYLLEVDVEDPRWHTIIQEPSKKTSREAATDREGQLLLSQELQRSILSSAQKSSAENIEDLSKLSQRLTQVSSEQSVEEVNRTIGRILGQTERATAPVATKPGGPFDYNSAQVHDVRKETLPSGEIRYMATMVDAAGRTLEVELDPLNGEQAFRTMQIVKSNPLLESVYRGVVMGLIDKMLQPPK